MTNEQTIALHNFEARVRQLMTAYQSLTEANEKLKSELADTQKELSDARTEIETEKKRYETLRTARIIEVSGDDIKASRARIARLIRDIDKSIALLDV